MRASLFKPFYQWYEWICFNYGSFRGWVRHLLTTAQFLLGVLDSYTNINPECKVQRLVFVCLGNINRSAFAQAVGESKGLHCASLGLATETGMPAYKKAVATASIMGIDLTKHIATDFSDHEQNQFDLYLVMEVRHINRLISLGISREQVILLGAWSAPKRIHLHDPHTLSDNYFYSCFTLIRSAVERLAIQLNNSKP
ncbi:arsenate reductase/protein-tyrosine-phosphatase family protein [Candidatus Nitrosacidococcus tergens]|uniref:protein-tyrosine-phosphatase n=1 Tax=Candidatus Nitrosacidococcus tergens TaxID=553981 RepID=A0A7G1Q8I0_9GAMM|nr:hypothetical protein [Candidatus Nitrosacidococcus tergens]CAB1275010.1 Predicted molecular weight phosphotyrosine protein phosphatase [Candidatus Nitrosacidococcus tergens]